MLGVGVADDDGGEALLGGIGRVDGAFEQPVRPAQQEFAVLVRETARVLDGAWFRHRLAIAVGRTHDTAQPAGRARKAPPVGRVRDGKPGVSSASLGA